MRIPIRAEFFLNNIMLDELSIITENLISDRSKLLYANKRRQLKGLPPMTPEEEKAYLAPVKIETAYIHQRQSGAWQAFRTPEPSTGNLIMGSSRLCIMVYSLATYEGYNTFLRNTNVLTDFITSPIKYRMIIGDELKTLLKEGEEWSV